MTDERFDAVPESSPTPAAPPAEWSMAAIRLLQGVVYHDDGHELWEMILRCETPLTDYFAKLGLLLVVDEPDAMAYLRQWDEDELPPEYPAIPRLFRRTPLNFEATLLCVLLRDELREYEQRDVQNERCIVEQSRLLPLWQAFFPGDEDEVKRNRALAATLRKLEDLKFVRQFEKEPPSWEIRRIIKARLPLAELEQMRNRLVVEISRRKTNADVVETPDEPVK